MLRLNQFCSWAGMVIVMESLDPFGAWVLRVRQPHIFSFEFFSSQSFSSIEKTDKNPKPFLTKHPRLISNTMNINKEVMFGVTSLVRVTPFYFYLYCLTRQKRKNVVSNFHCSSFSLNQHKKEIFNSRFCLYTLFTGMGSISTAERLPTVFTRFQWRKESDWYSIQRCRLRMQERWCELNSQS